MTEHEVPISLDEVARLRAENEQLRALVARQASQAGVPRRRRRVGRWTVAAVFLLVGFLLLPVGAVALWARAVLFNTDRYVETVAPLARDPAVRDAVADRITNEVFVVLDIEGFTSRAIDGLVKQGAPAELVMLRQPTLSSISASATASHRARTGGVIPPLISRPTHCATNRAASTLPRAEHVGPERGWAVVVPVQ